MPIWKGTGSTKRAEGTAEAPAGSSGWATINGKTREPYILDSGVTSIVIPGEMLRNLSEHGPAFKQEGLDQPIQIIQADGSWRILVDRVAYIDTTLTTEAGPARLGKVTYRVARRRQRDNNREIGDEAAGHPNA